MLLLDTEIDIFVASRIGSFKHIKYHTDPTKNNKKCIENLVDIKTLQKDDAITCMEWGNEDQTEILLSRKNLEIQSFNTELTSLNKTYTADFGTGVVVGLGRYKKRLLAAMSSGVVKIWSKKEEQIIDTGGKLDCMRLCGDNCTMFATGGEENDLKVWSVGAAAPLFSAKNLAHDWLQLRRPVWLADLCFAPGAGGALLAACSRHGYVRLYDTRAQRRPVCNVDTNGMAATCIAPSFDDRQFLVGFGRGQLHQVELRAGRLDKGYKDCVGSVTRVAAVASGARRLVLSASLDRHLRVHSHGTKELLYKKYLTSKLASLLVQDKHVTSMKQELKEEEIKEEDLEGALEERHHKESKDELDELFEGMETVVDEPKKKKVRIPPELAEQLRRKSKKIKLSGDEDQDVADTAQGPIAKLLRVKGKTAISLQGEPEEEIKEEEADGEGEVELKDKISDAPKRNMARIPTELSKKLRKKSKKIKHSENKANIAEDPIAKLLKNTAMKRKKAKK